MNIHLPATLGCDFAAGLSAPGRMEHVGGEAVG